MHHQYCWFASCICGLFNLIDWSTHTIVLFANFIDVAISVSYFLSSHTFASLHTCSLTSYLFLPLHLSHLFTCLMHRQSVVCLSFFRKATYIMCPPSVHLCIAYAIRLSFLARFVLVSLESCLRICVLHASYHNPSQLSHTSYHVIPLIHWLFRKTLVSLPPPPGGHMSTFGFLPPSDLWYGLHTFLEEDNWPSISKSMTLRPPFLGKQSLDANER